MRELKESACKRQLDSRRCINVGLTGIMERVYEILVYKIALSGSLATYIPVFNYTYNKGCCHAFI